MRPFEWERYDRWATHDEINAVRDVLDRYLQTRPWALYWQVREYFHGAGLAIRQPPGPYADQNLPRSPEDGLRERSGVPTLDILITEREPQRGRKPATKRVFTVSVGFPESRDVGTVELLTGAALQGIDAQRGSL